MGYNVYAADTKFFLSADKQDAALKKLHEWMEQEGNEHHVTVTLEDELEHWGFNTTCDEMQNITGVFPNDSRLNEEQNKTLFGLLAPFVLDGSFLMYFGEDAAMWGWKFRLDKATGEVQASVEDVYGVFESDMTEEQKKHYVEEFEGGPHG